jgi:hypothetical protein
MNDFNENKSYEITYNNVHFQLFTDAIQKYYDYLSRFRDDGNEALETELLELEWLLESIAIQAGKARHEWGLASLYLQGKYWRIIKATLPYLSNEFQAKKDGIMLEAGTELAVEGIDKKIVIINELLTTNFLSTVPELEINMPKAGTEPKPGGVAGDEYIPTDMIEKLRQLQNDKFNLRKLISLLEEINDHYSRKNIYGFFAILRAITDHVPPIFNQKTYDSVVSNHGWATKSDKNHIESLTHFRKIGDNALHTQISDKQDLLDITDFPPSVLIRTLIQECGSRLSDTQPRE